MLYFDSMAFFNSTLPKALRKLTAIIGQWGRVADRTIFTDAQPDENPDPIDSERYFKISGNPYIKAGLNYRDVSRLFVSAKGLEPDESGAFFPAQLIYTTPEGGEQEQLDALAEQFDELFVGGPAGQQGFNAILQGLQFSALTYGRAIAEIEWYRAEKGIRASYIWSRDPEEYFIDPPDVPAGIYKKNHSSYSSVADSTRMPDGKFMVITFDSLFNNPYGQSVLRPLADMTETWDKVYDSWRQGCINAGYGAWLGEYGPSLRGNSDAAVKGKIEFLKQLKLIRNGSASIFDQENNIRAEKLQFDAGAFLDFHTSYVQAVSVLLTGSATALIEGKFGSFAKEEATTVRQKSDKEQADALLMGAAFTSQFNRFFMLLNYGVDAVVPQLQLIRPELIMPTTPQGQDTQDDIQEDTDAVEKADPEPEEDKDDKPAELAEGDDEEEEEEPRRYGNFPDPQPEPDIYAEVEDAAKEYLEQLPVKNYHDVTQDESANVFTVKRLRNYDGDVALLNSLKEIIISTVGAKSEAEAWKQYVPAAQALFASVNLPWSSSLESDLIISFRQARQSAYQAGIVALIDSNPDGLTGIEIVTMEDDRVRPVHKLWQGIVLAPGDTRLEKLRAPMDFGCRCNNVPVYNGLKPLTPENELPDIYPGETYRGYA